MQKIQGGSKANWNDRGNTRHWLGLNRGDHPCMRVAVQSDLFIAALANYPFERLHGVQ